MNLWYCMVDVFNGNTHLHIQTNEQIERRTKMFQICTVIVIFVYLQNLVSVELGRK